MLERTEPVDSTGENEETGKDGSQQIVDFGSALTKTPHGSVYPIYVGDTFLVTCSSPLCHKLFYCLSLGL